MFGCFFGGGFCLFVCFFVVLCFQQTTKPWWKIKLFVWEPVLFGTWDGVFTTCMINIFGVVLFLRSGYLVVRLQTFDIIGACTVLM